MVVTQKGFEELASKYEELLALIMCLHCIEEITCDDEKEHFFDRIVLSEGSIRCYNHGFQKPFNGLPFDFSVDYATCIAHIEHDLFLAEREGKPKYGMTFKFNNRTNESEESYN